MATRNLPILGANTVPDATGRCWLEPYDVAATNDVWKHLVARFKDPSAAQEHGLYVLFDVPDDYVTTTAPIIVPIWTATATTGNCRWRFIYRSVGGDDTTSLDQAGSVEGVSLTDAAPTAAHRRLAPTGLALTGANFAAGDTVEGFFSRLDDTGVDTMAADALLFRLLFRYANA